MCVYVLIQGAFDFGTDRKLTSLVDLDKHNERKRVRQLKSATAECLFLLNSIMGCFLPIHWANTTSKNLKNTLKHAQTLMHADTYLLIKKI